MNIPAPATIMLSADLFQRLGRLPHEARHLELDDVPVILGGVGLGDYTSADAAWVLEHIRTVALYAGQLEEAAAIERRA